MKIVVLDSYTADQDDPSAWEALRALGEVTLFARTFGMDVQRCCAGADAVITNKAIVDAALMAAVPTLKYVGVSATGTNIVDLDAARARGIAVTNVPGYSTESVAQLAFALILHLTVDVAGHAAAVRAGQWAQTPDFCFFLRPLAELSGKTLVLIGAGAIGKATKRIAEGFGMTVIAAAVPGSATANRVPLLAALQRADVVTLHCPLTPATRGMVNEAFLARMKPTAILINTSRGGLVDEPALVAALQRGHLGGVGLDVLSAEPPPKDHPLTDAGAPFAGRVVVTPHIAWGTVEARARLRQAVADNLGAFLQGQAVNRVA